MCTFLEAQASAISIVFILPSASKYARDASDGICRHNDSPAKVTRPLLSYPDIDKISRKFPYKTLNRNKERTADMKRISGSLL